MEISEEVIDKLLLEALRWRVQYHACRGHYDAFKLPNEISMMREILDKVGLKWDDERIADIVYRNILITNMG